MNTPASNNTLIVVGYALQLVGFLIVLVEIVLIRLGMSAWVRRLSDTWLRRTTEALNVRVSDVVTTREEIKAIVIRAAPGPDTESRVSHLEGQVADLAELIDRQAERFEQRVREQQSAQEQFENEIAAGVAGQEHRHRREVIREAKWTVAPTLLFIVGTVLGIIGTLN